MAGCHSWIKKVLVCGGKNRAKSTSESGNEVCWSLGLGMRQPPGPCGNLTERASGHLSQEPVVIYHLMATAPHCEGWGIIVIIR